MLDFPDDLVRSLTDEERRQLRAAVWRTQRGLEKFRRQAIRRAKLEGEARQILDEAVDQTLAELAEIGGDYDER